MFFPHQSFIFSVNLESVEHEHAQFAIMICYTHFPIIMHNTTDTICNPWTAWKSDRATKILVTLLFHDGFEKRKIPIKTVYTFFWNMMFFVSYYFIFGPEKNP